MTVLVRLVLGFLLLKLGVLLGNLRQFPVLRRAEPAMESVSVLVPMRNEATGIARTLPGLLAQLPDAEVIVLDDGSDDGSAELLTALIAGHPRARMVTGEPAPDGWVGKNWACQQLGTLATGDVLLFCDSDIVLAPGAFDAVLAECRRQNAALFSVFPRQLCGSLGERLVTPLIDDVLLCFLPFALLSLDIPAAATANGSLLVFTRTAWNDLGGFAGVRGQLVEDVALARLVRSRGQRLGLALGGVLVSTRMYRGYPATVRGLARGLLPVTGGSRAVLVAAAGWHLAAYTLPLLLARRDHRWRAALLLGLTERFLVQAKTNPATGWQALLTPLCPPAFLPLVAQALRPQQRWKGRVYR